MHLVERPQACHPSPCAAVAHEAQEGKAGISAKLTRPRGRDHSLRTHERVRRTMRIRRSAASAALWTLVGRWKAAWCLGLLVSSALLCAHRALVCLCCGAPSVWCREVIGVDKEGGVPARDYHADGHPLPWLLHPRESPNYPSPSRISALVVAAALALAAATWRLDLPLRPGLCAVCWQLPTRDCPPRVPYQPSGKQPHAKLPFFCGHHRGLL